MSATHKTSSAGQVRHLPLRERSRLLLWCRSGLLLRHYRAGYVRPGCDERNARHVGDFAAFGVVDLDSGMIEQKAGRAIQFNLGFLVGRHGRDPC